MVIVEFTPKNAYGKKAKDYFIGQDLESIWQDTNTGKRFAGVEYESSREISRREAARMVMADSLEAGQQAIMRGSSKSFKLDAKKM